MADLMIPGAGRSLAEMGANIETQPLHPALGPRELRAARCRCWRGLRPSGDDDRDEIEIIGENDPAMRDGA